MKVTVKIKNLEISDDVNTMQEAFDIFSSAYEAFDVEACGVCDCEDVTPGKFVTEKTDQNNKPIKVTSYYYRCQNCSSIAFLKQTKDGELYINKNKGKEGWHKK